MDMKELLKLLAGNTCEAQEKIKDHELEDNTNSEGATHVINE